MNSSNELTGLRRELDLLDAELLDVLVRRFEVVRAVGIYKLERQISPLDTARWEEVLKSRLKWARDKGLSEDMVRDIFEAIHRAAVEAEGESPAGK